MPVLLDFNNSYRNTFDVNAWQDAKRKAREEAAAEARAAEEAAAAEAAAAAAKEEQLKSRPLWQKAIDVLPGQQFRESAFVRPELPTIRQPQLGRYGRLDKAMGGALPFGAPITREEMAPGAAEFTGGTPEAPLVFPDDPVMKDLARGIGGLATTVGGTAGWAGKKDLAAGFNQFGEKLIGDNRLTPGTPGEFGVGHKAIESLPFMGALLPVGLAGAAGGSAAAGALGLGALGTAIAGVGGSVALSRPLESLMEAGGVYNDALKQGMSEDQAARAAKEVFLKNLPMGATDFLELGTAFLGTRFLPKPLRGTITKALETKFGRNVIDPAVKIAMPVLMEGQEENLQQIAQQQALGDRRGIVEQIKNPTAAQKEATQIGGLMGGLFGGTGIITGLNPQDKAPEIPAPEPTPAPLQRPPLAEQVRSVMDKRREAKIYGPALGNIDKSPYADLPIPEIIKQEAAGPPVTNATEAPGMNVPPAPVSTTQVPPSATDETNVSKSIARQYIQDRSTDPMGDEDVIEFANKHITGMARRLAKGDYLTYDELEAHPEALAWMLDKGIVDTLQDKSGKAYYAFKGAKVPAFLAPAAPAADKAEQSGKEPWEMTKAEYALDQLGSKSRPGEFGYPEDAGDSEIRKFENILHRKEIEKALAEGKAVPAAVLADYPDLTPAADKAPAKSPADMTDKELEDRLNVLLGEIGLPSKPTPPADKEEPAGKQEPKGGSYATGRFADDAISYMIQNGTITSARNIEDALDAFFNEEYKKLSKNITDARKPKGYKEVLDEFYNYYQTNEGKIDIVSRGRAALEGTKTDKPGTKPKPPVFDKLITPEALQQDLHDRLIKDKAVINAATGSDKQNLGVEIRARIKKHLGDMITEYSQDPGMGPALNKLTEYESKNIVEDMVTKTLTKDIQNTNTETPSQGGGNDVKSNQGKHDWLEQAQQAARDRIKSREGRLMAGLPMDDMLDYAIIGAAKLADGALTLGEFTQAMIADFTADFGKAVAEKARAWMPGIYGQAMAIVDMTPEQVEEMIADANEGKGGPKDGTPDSETLDSGNEKGTADGQLPPGDNIDSGRGPGRDRSEAGGKNDGKGKSDVSIQQGEGGPAGPRSDIQDSDQGVPEDKGRKGKGDRTEDSEARERPGTGEDTPGGTTGNQIENYQIDEQNPVFTGGGKKTRYLANVAALKTLDTVLTENRAATIEEQRTMALFSGWGALPEVLDAEVDRYMGTRTPKYEKWSDEFYELKKLIEELEEKHFQDKRNYRGDLYRNAAASTMNAHYTSPKIIGYMYDALLKMGFKGGNVLEPSMGIGNFFGMLPRKVAGRAKLYGVELDPITGAIASLLYPNAAVQIKGFQDAIYPDNFFDVAVGNVPFGNYPVADKRYPKHVKERIHNYFFAKTLDKVKPGGVVAFITSTGTLDTPSNVRTREYLAHKAEFIGAIRLPGDAFKENAGTEVTTDIIFMRKYQEGALPETGGWTQTGVMEVEGEEVNINQYYLDNPHMVLGDFTIDTLTKGKRLGVKAGEKTVDELLPEVIEKYLPENIINTRLTKKDVEITPETQALLEGMIDGGIVKDKGKLYRRVGGKLEHITKDVAQITTLVEIRDMAKELLTLQRQPEIKDSELDVKRKKMKAAYDGYVKKYGNLLKREVRGNRLYGRYQVEEVLGHRTIVTRLDPKTKKEKGYSIFITEPEAYLLKSLEIETVTLDKNGVPVQSFKPSQVLLRRTYTPARIVDKVNSAQDGVIASINSFGYLDMDYIAEIYGKPEEEIVKELGGHIYKNPVGTWETSDEYLSGNVRRKLEEAEERLEYDEEYQRNVEALREVIPADLPLADITVSLGDPWLPFEVNERAVARLLGVSERGAKDHKIFKLAYNPSDNTWNLSKGPKYRNTPEMSAIAAGAGGNALDIVKKALNNADTIVKWKDKDGHTHVDKEATDTLKAKVKELRESIKDYIYEFPEYVEAVEKEYNRKFNAIVPRDYEKVAKYFTFPNMNPEIKLREHQVVAIVRALLGGNTLLAHGVGAGKTYEEIAIAMEARRLGLATKPVLLVPNTKLTDFENCAKEMYPGAKILALSSDDFDTDSIKRTLAIAAVNEWDIVIIRHSSFTKIPISPETEIPALEAEIAELEEALASMDEDSGRFTKKQMENRLETLRVRLITYQQDRVTYKGMMNFEDLGFDMLIVDEAHEYKNYPLAGRTASIKGLKAGDAQKARDMMIKAGYIKKINGSKRGLIFATGTPIANTMAEVYVMFRYLRPDLLQEAGISNLDAWAGTFTNIENVMEIAARGGFKNQFKFKSFVNLPELFAMFREFTDIKMQDVLNLPLPEAKFNTVECTPHPMLKEVMKEVDDNWDQAARDGQTFVYYNMMRSAPQDMRLVKAGAENHKGSKIDRVVENVVKTYKAEAKNKGTQLIFLHKGESGITGFSLWDEIKKQLVKKGIPANEIAYVKSGTNEDELQGIYQKVNSGKIRVVIGSYAKLGVGINVQERLAALHEIDIPYRPADIEQAEGRMIRQNNLYYDLGQDVNVYRYVTVGEKDTFSGDAYNWQLIEGKIRDINSLMKGDPSVRTMGAFDADAHDAAVMKAVAVGDERWLTKVELEKEIDILKGARNSYLSGLSIARQRKTAAEWELRTLERSISGAKDAIQIIELEKNSTKEEKQRLSVGGKNITFKDAGDLEAVEKELVDQIHEYEEKPSQETGEHPIGHYRGLTLKYSQKKSGDLLFQDLSIYRSWDKVAEVRKDVVSLKKGSKDHYLSEREYLLAKFIRTINKLPEMLAKSEKKAEQLTADVGKYEKIIEAPFKKQDELDKKKQELKDLDKALGIGIIAVKTSTEEEEDDAEQGMYVAGGLRDAADAALSRPGEDSGDIQGRHSPQKTSIKQIAAGLRLAVSKEIFTEGMTIIDVGGGLWEKGTEYLAGHGVTGLVYDPYARTKEHNDRVLAALEDNGGADAAALNNVLNVIPTKKERADVLKYLYALLKPGGRAVITVYEGNRSGTGAKRQFNDGSSTWQENRIRASYEEEIRQALPGAAIEAKGSAFVLTKMDTDLQDIQNMAGPRRRTVPVKPTQRTERKQAKGPEVQSFAPPPGTPSGPEAPPAGRGDDTIRRRDIVKFLEERFAPIRVRRFRQKALGIFKVKPEVIRTKVANDLNTIAHEIGHYLDKKLVLGNPQFEAELWPLGLVASRKNYTQDQVRKEGVAEFVRLYLMDPLQAKKDAPLFYAEFTRILQENPEVADSLATAQADIKLWLTQPAAARVLGVINTTGKTSRKMTLDRLYSITVDEIYPLKKFVEKIGIPGLATEKDPYKLAWLARGWTGKAETLLHHGVLDAKGKKIGMSLDEILEPVKHQLDDFRAYAVARHSLEVTAQDKLTGIKDEDAQEVVDNAPELYQEVLGHLVGFQDHLLGMLVKSGIMTQASVDHMRQLYPNYVPFQRVFDEDISAITAYMAKGGYGNLSNPVKPLKGSEREIIDPLESIVKNIYTFVNIAERNSVGRAIVQLADSKDGMGQFVEEVSAQYNVAKENILTVYVDGKAKKYQLEPELYRATLALDKEASNLLVKILSYPASWLRAGATLSPDFMVRNPVRDQFSAFINSKYGYIPGVDLIRGTFHAIKKDDMYWLFQNSGAAHSTLVSLDRDYLQKSIKDLIGKKSAKEKMITVINPGTYIEMLRAFSELGEYGTRLGEFAKGVESGAGVADAALSARDITLDFNRIGSHFKSANRIIAFSNATIQGADKMVRQFKEKPAQTMLSVALSITLPSVILFLLNHDDDRYKELPQWEKDLFWIVLTKNKIFRIPKPFELGILFGTMPERALAWALDKDPKAFKGAIQTITEALMPGYIPTAIIPFIETWANKSTFTGLPIVPQREQRLAGWAQYGPYTTETAKGLGRMINWSPRKIETFLRGWTGGLGLYTVKLFEGVGELTGVLPKGNKPALNAENIPVVKAFMAQEYASPQSVEDFYDEMNDLEAKYSTSKETRQAILTAQQYERLKGMRKVADKLSDIRKAERAVMADKTITPEQKRQASENADWLTVNLVRVAQGKQPVK